MTQFTAPQSVTQNIARAKSLVKRDEPVRAIDSLVTALELFEPAKIIGKARYEVEVNIIECVADLSRHPKVHSLLVDLTKSKTAAINYTPGEEQKLLPTLKVLRKAIFELDEQKIKAAYQKIEERKSTLLEKGKAHLAAGETPRGKGVLRQLADEFGTEPGILLQIGTLLGASELHYDAIEFLEQALEIFPEESRIYAELVQCYQALAEYDKLEAIYLKAIQQFGQHPKTLLNLARFYLSRNKKDDAYETAKRALRADPGSAEAQEIMAAADR